ncbi:MAG TPA: histidine--tRNA ligase [Opitutae bacterium]|nr:histidine--tRNA ligase [Opitutae bacterium]
MMFQALPGFRDFYPEDCQIRNHIFKIWRQVALRFGFSEYDAPILEPLELFTEKSGEEIVQQLFAFTDRGGRAVSLRPEMTPSLARLVGSRASALKRPIKWFNIGEHYRYERPQKGRLRSFYQLNLDLFDEDQPIADAEVIALAIEIFRAFGLTHNDFFVRLSDRTVWTLILENEGVTNVPGALNVIDKLERESAASICEKLGQHMPQDRVEAVFAKIQMLCSIKDFDALCAFLKTNEAFTERLEQWKTLIKTLECMGLSKFVQVDLGVVRGLAYYTGFVFEFFEKSGKSRALAGGGRYDELVKKLGGPDMPAVGLAIGDVTLKDLLEEKELLPLYFHTVDLFVIIGEGESEKTCAYQDILDLRRAGWSVSYSFTRSFKKQFKQADDSHADFALIYGSEEVSDNKVKIRNLKQRDEQTFSRVGLIENLKAILSRK